MGYDKIEPPRDNTDAIPIGADVNQISTNQSQIVDGSDGSSTPPTIDINALHILVQALSTDIRYTTDIKDSGGTFNWTGTTPNFTVTIPFATHGITIQDDFGINITLYKLVGGKFKTYIPVEREIDESTGDVTIENSSNLDLYLVIT